jgi:hypothetical protein
MSGWTEEREAELENLVGNENPVTQVTVASAAEALEVSGRSVSSKLRKMGYDVEKVSARAKTFSDEQEADLREFVESNSGEFTYAEIAERFAGGTFTPRQIQGKILSLELTEAVKRAPKPESTKTYTEEEEATILELVQGGAFIEDIVEAVGRPLNSVRGKLLSMSRQYENFTIPKQRESHAAKKVDPFEGLDVAELTVAEIAEKIGKSPRGVRVMLTNRGLNCADYNAKVKKEA